MTKENKSKKNKNLINLGDRGWYHKKNKLNDLTGKEWLKFTKSWEIVNPRRRKIDQLLHPAKFPEELIISFLQYFTKEHDLVFDPFAGSGTFGQVSNELNRNFFLTEIDKKYFQRINEKLSEAGLFGADNKYFKFNDFKNGCSKKNSYKRNHQAIDGWKRLSNCYTIRNH